MITAEQDAKQLIARLLRRSLERGTSVEIEGLGTFLPGIGGGFRFIAQSKPRVFIAYVEEDLVHAQTLFAQFTAAGFNPWLDKQKLLPGQNWPRAIETAIQCSDYFVPCFSKHSVSKRGSFHCELRFALECANRIPLDEIFMIPVRIDACLPPARITKSIQYVDLFPSWDEGIQRVINTIQEQETARKGKREG